MFQAIVFHLLTSLLINVRLKLNAGHASGHCKLWRAQLCGAALVPMLLISERPSCTPRGRFLSVSQAATSGRNKVGRPNAIAKDGNFTFRWSKTRGVFPGRFLWSHAVTKCVEKAAQKVARLQLGLSV